MIAVSEVSPADWHPLNHLDILPSCRHDVLSGMDRFAY
jgi:hypothetical protein